MRNKKQGRSSTPSRLKEILDESISYVLHLRITKLNDDNSPLTLSKRCQASLFIHLDNKNKSKMGQLKRAYILTVATASRVDIANNPKTLI